MVTADTRLSSEEITRTRAEHRITAVLRRAGIDCPDSRGRDVMISCPTAGHEDSTPSCIVHPASGTFYCFGCGTHGDVFTLVREVTGITNLAQAAELLDGGGPITWRAGSPARRTALAVGKPAAAPEPDRTLRERILEVNDAAWRYLASDRLADQARSYLSRRGIDVWTVEARTSVPVAGYSPVGRTALTDHLRRTGFTRVEIVDAGWTVDRPDGMVDRFHRRVLLPIRDAAGRVAGVIGRDVTGNARCKYLNMPRTAAYSKGELLYQPSGMHNAAHTVVIVCEGPLDALAITAAAGLRRDARIHAVAPCGTALTGTQAQLIASLDAREVIVCADSDPGGVAAASKWQSILRAQHLTPRTVTLPAGHDPASWLAHAGPSGLDTLLDTATPQRAMRAIDRLSPTVDGGLTA